MLNRKKAHTAINPNTINVISKGSRIEGNFYSKGGDIRIDGSVLGSIHCESKMVSGVGSVIEGDIHSNNADISGKIIGNIYIKDTLVLKSSSVIQGNIQEKRMIMETGAIFDGQCKMEVSEKVKFDQKQNASQSSQ